MFESVDKTMADILRTKSAAERLAIANRMWKSARQMLLHRLKQEHPDWSEEKIRRETARRLSHGAV